MMLAGSEEEQAEGLLRVHSVIHNQIWVMRVFSFPRVPVFTGFYEVNSDNSRYFFFSRVLFRS